MPAAPFRRSSLVLRAVGLVSLAVLVLAATACSGSSDSDGEATPPPGVQCPFSGEARRLTGGSSEVKSETETVSGVTAARADCVDTLTVVVDGDIPTWTVAYLTPPLLDDAGAEIPLTSPVHLAITINRSAYGPGGTPATIPVEGLQFAESIQVLELGGRTVVLVGLDANKQFQAQSSGGTLSVAIG